MKKKLLSFIFAICLIIPVMFMLSACDVTEDDDVRVRVHDGYVQWCTPTSDWENIITIDEILDSIGDDLKGEQGNPGLNGKQVVFRKTETHIQWSYEGSESWTDLIALIEIKGDTGSGEKGADGNGIKSITIDQSRSDETKTTYVITFDNGTTYSYEVKNGTNGSNGSVVTIGENGNWFIDGKDTGVLARGTNGSNGTNGTNGKDGNGIKSIMIDQDNSDETKTTYIITFDNDTTYSFEVKNGINGINGTNGKNGSVVTIGEDGYWYIDGKKTDVKARAEEVSIDTYTITYDYGVANVFFDNAKESESLKATQWLTNIPEIKEEYKNSFLGWFIKDTNKQIEDYDFIGGNVTLEARFDVQKATVPGLYQNGKYVTTWDNLIKSDSGYTVSPVLRRYDGYIVMDDSITELSMNAFADKTELTGIRFGKNLSSIGVCAFMRCTNLREVHFNSSITTLGGQAFGECTSLEEITIPGTIKSIQQYTFSGCTNLSKFTIENGVESIDSLIITGTKIKSVYIPQSVITISTTAFVSSELEEYIVDKNNSHFSSVDGVLFDKDKTTLLSCPQKLNISDGEYIIPSSVDDIGYQAFYMSELTSITLPDELKIIRTEAFYYCSSLNGIRVPQYVVSIGSNAFKGCKEGFTLIINDLESKWEIWKGSMECLITIDDSGWFGTINGGEEISLGELITTTYVDYTWSKQITE
ncbi:MAG: leucine-rich repeat protein [Clostridia bacterium]|nr:leucine-rich repeat protein [Clostridia bacterium]